ncbi:MAG: hypothetical protein O2985_15790, partial [Proteobacteria bacterium]|nr:hypothetical protein [Pseudomonadota bacterium]
AIMPPLRGKSTYPNCSVFPNHLSELLTPPIYEMVGLFMTTCLEVPAIYRNFGTLYSDTEKRWGAGERVFLPCRSDDGQVDCVIGVTVLDASEAVPGVPTRSFFRCGPTAAPIS